jgi:hypothetical protein
MDISEVDISVPDIVVEQSPENSLLFVALFVKHNCHKTEMCITISPFRYVHKKECENDWIYQLNPY